MKVCVAYELDGERFEHLPYHQSRPAQGASPSTRSCPGWQTDLTARHRARTTCPPQARDYLAVPRGAGRRADPPRRRRSRSRPVRALRGTERRCGSASSGAAGASTRSPTCSAARPTRSWSRPGNPGIPGSVADAAGGDRRRPLRDRPGGSRSSTAWPTGCGRRASSCSGPGADGARLEGSKAWMKEVLVDGRRADRAPRRRSTERRAGARLPRRRCPASTS